MERQWSPARVAKFPHSLVEGKGTQSGVRTRRSLRSCGPGTGLWSSLGFLLATGVQVPNVVSQRRLGPWDPCSSARVPDCNVLFVCWVPI